MTFYSADLVDKVPNGAIEESMKHLDVIKQIEAIAPRELAEPWDNPGLMIGSLDRECSGVVLSLDLTRAAVEKAIQGGANLIITHHPFFFHAVKSIDTSTARGELLRLVMSNDITVYSAHTNFDMATDGGLCVSLAMLLGGKVLSPDGVGVVCELKPTTLKAFAQSVARILKDDSVKYVGDDDKMISKAFVICGGGASDSALEHAMSCADVFVSGDFKHHLYVNAHEDNFPIVEFSHYASEIIVEDLFEKLIAPLGVKTIKAKQCCPFKTVGGHNEI